MRNFISNLTVALVICFCVAFSSIAEASSYTGGNQYDFDNIATIVSKLENRANDCKNSEFPSRTYGFSRGTAQQMIRDINELFKYPEFKNANTNKDQTCVGNAIHDLCCYIELSKCNITRMTRKQAKKLNLSSSFRFIALMKRVLYYVENYAC